MSTKRGFAPWIEAMRLRTLPVSVAGVLAGWIVAFAYGSFRILPALICLFFAIGAQIVSNFANEYFDYANGLDKKGREGFRRGVTEGDIDPKKMLRATLSLLGLVCLMGLSLIYWGGWWLLPIGIVIAIAALAYSAGPWPLSHHGLGDVAVIIFFGIVPVCLTAYVQLPDWDAQSIFPAIHLTMIQAALPISTGIGLMAADVLIVNNVRDIEDDRAVNKKTTAVLFGRRTMTVVYLIFALVGLALIVSPFISLLPILAKIIWIIPAFCAVKNYHRLTTLRGAALNNVLKQTALLLAASIILLAAQLLILYHIL